MINAETARKNSVEFEENRKKALFAKLNEWVETVVGAAVATASTEGRYSVWVQEFKEHYTIQENREYICGKLVALGYRVNILPSGSLDVHWN